MTTETDPTYTIGEVSERTGISTHTLRFYEKVCSSSRSSDLQPDDDSSPKGKSAGFASG